jgi:hypothetical protein
MVGSKPLKTMLDLPFKKSTQPLSVNNIDSGKKKMYPFHPISTLLDPQPAKNPNPKGKSNSKQTHPNSKFSTVLLLFRVLKKSISSEI